MDKIEKPVYRRGAPFIICEEFINKIVEATPKVLVRNQIAALVGMAPSTLYDWLETGKKDQKNNKDTLHAQLVERYNKAKAEELARLLEMLKELPRNYQAITWLIEKCFREDFGSESEELRELRTQFMRILPLLERERRNG